MNNAAQKRFREEMELRALSPRTISSYEVSLKKFFSFYKGRDAKSLCIPEIKAYQRSLVKKNYSAHSINVTQASTGLDG